MLRFLHTSDWQLGAGFAQVPGDKGAALRRQRLETLDAIGQAARQHGAAFVVVAGDLFDAHTVENDVVTQACERIGRFGLDVYAIPGNHDFARAPESVYRRDRFLQRRPANFHLLDQPQPVALAPANTLLLPCPLLQRHTVSDPTAWLAERPGADLLPGGFRIGLAHGSVVDFEAEEGGTSANLIDPAIVERGGLDYLALGDWHGLRQVRPRAWYSGTPEPDRFKDNQAGHVCLVEIDSPGGTLRVTPLAVAGCRWLRHGATLHGEADLQALEHWFAALPQPEKCLVRLELDGVLGMQALARLQRVLDTQSELLMHLRRRGPGIRLRPSDEELRQLQGAGLTGRVAQRLHELLGAGGERSELAALALQMLYQFACQPAQGAVP